MPYVFLSNWCAILKYKKLIPQLNLDPHGINIKHKQLEREHQGPVDRGPEVRDGALRPLPTRKRSAGRQENGPAAGRRRLRGDDHRLAEEEIGGNRYKHYVSNLRLK